MRLDRFCFFCHGRTLPRTVTGICLCWSSRGVSGGQSAGPVFVPSCEQPDSKVKRGGSVDISASSSMVSDPGSLIENEWMELREHCELPLLSRLRECAG